jgi:hypothetical protein
MPRTFATLFGKARVATGQDWKAEKSDQKKDSDPGREELSRCLTHGKPRLALAGLIATLSSLP